MAGTLTVQTLQGPSSGANANKLLIPSGQTLDVSSGTLVPSAGQVVQVQTRKYANVGFSTTSGSLVDITNFYVDITPTSSNSIIVFQSSITGVNVTTAGYARFAIKNGNTGTQWSSNSYIAHMAYNGAQWVDTPLIHSNTAGTTSAMRLQLQVVVGSSGQADFNWSGGDDRTITAWEIAQ